MNKHKYQYKWTLKDAKFTKDKGTVFSCFACGGGSTMGYKLAGFDVIGCNEIDKRMNEVYVANHEPKYNYLCDIREIVAMAKKKELPAELYNLDILDGSPPCSSFSTSGDREKGWGKEKHFREGQSKQVLDTLFFDFIELAKELKPKIVIGENVKGMLLGTAIKYVAEIRKEFENAGFSMFLKLLDASKMGVPQRRERCFFVCVRNEYLNILPKSGFFNDIDLDLNFNEKEIKYKEIADYEGDEIKEGTALRNIWENKKEGENILSETNKRVFNKNTFFSDIYAYDDNILPTLTGHKDRIIPFRKPKYLSENEVKKCSSFPLDYDFKNQNCHYICGMSVPPVMMANVATRVYEQWLKKIKEEK